MLPITEQPSDLNRARTRTRRRCTAQRWAKTQKQMLSWETIYVISVIFFPQPGWAKHNNILATIDAFPQFTELMERVSKCVSYFSHQQCTSTRTRTHAQAQTQTPANTFCFLFSQTPLSELRGRSNASKVTAARGCVGR